MKIVDLKLREVRGVMEHPDPFWEERLIQPVDVYPEFRRQGVNFLPGRGDGRYDLQAVFLEIHTDDGVTGLSGPCSRNEAFVVDTDRLHPVAGTITVPDAPGLGLAIDESRVTAQRELNFRDV